MRDQAAMLRDIISETVLCRAWTGKAELDPRVLAALRRVPRERFVPDELRELACRNGPLPIGHGQTISQPFIVALMTDLLAPCPTDTVLEVGTGSGYQAAILAELAARVVTLEIVPPLADLARRRLAELGYRNIECRLGDGYQGWPAEAPYDGILVTAAAPHVPPPLLAQLKPGGRLVIPVGPAGRTQSLRVVEKTEKETWAERTLLDVVFVPLTGPLGSPY